MGMFIGTSWNEDEEDVYIDSTDDWYDYKDKKWFSKDGKWYKDKYEYMEDKYGRSDRHYENTGGFTRMKKDITVEDWLGADNKLGQDIWNIKYRNENETFVEWLDRVCNGNDKIRQLIIDKKFLFGGRILASRGLQHTGKKVTFSNCYVVTPPEDSLEGIFDSARDMGRTFSYGGGVGVDFSKLRGRGTKVNNTAKTTTGAVSFMDLYNTVTETIGQGGRRSAMMISLDALHPDAMEFIRVKSDLNKVTKANISLKMTDEFMREVEKGTTEYKTSFIVKDTGEVIEHIVNPTALFDEMCRMNWDFAEPGVLYWDRIENYHMASEDKDIKFAGVNPCLTGDTLIQTKDGLVCIKDLVGKTPIVWCMDNEQGGGFILKQASKVWLTKKDAELVEVFYDDYSIRCTPDHLIFTNRGWIQAQHLVSEDVVYSRDGYELVEKIVDKVEFLSIREDVYDMTVPVVHNFIANGIVVHNCAEQPLMANQSCLLGSINLAEFVKEDGTFDYMDFEKAVEQGVIALNEVLDEGIELHPLQAQRDIARDYRNIGLGMFGLGDCLIKMGITYGSKESLDISEKIAHRMANMTLRTSALLAKKNGAYPKYKKEAVLKSKYLETVADKVTMDMIKKWGVYNIACLTIAPTGSLGTMLQTSTALEPNFMIFYTRKTESLHDKDVFYKVFIQPAKEYMEKHGLEDESQLPEYFITSGQIHWKDRVAMQSVWQKYIDASISSTVNLPETATVEDVRNIYMTAWKMGLKGITVFRDNCKRLGILTSGEKKEEAILQRGEVKEQAEDTIYHKRRLNIGCGTLNLMIGYSETENAIQDLYVIKKGAGGCEKNLQGLAISFSTILRLGGNLDTIADSITGISTCPSFAVNRGNVSKGNTCAGAILNILKDFMNENNIKSHIVHKKSELKIEKSDSSCPECGEELQFVGGCNQCGSCGYSKCS